MKTAPMRLQPLDHDAVMDDFVADIDRRAIFRQGQFDDPNRPFHAGAKPARGGEQQLEMRPLGRGPFCSVLPIKSPLGYSPPLFGAGPEVCRRVLKVKRKAK